MTKTPPSVPLHIENSGAEGDIPKKTGCGSQQEADEIQLPGFLLDPSEQVKKDEAGMKYRKR